MSKNPCLNYFSLVAFATILSMGAKAQPNDENKVGRDTAYVLDLIAKAQLHYFYLLNADSCVYYAGRAEEISRRIDFTSGLSKSLNMKSAAYRSIGNYPKALEALFEVHQLLSSAGPSLDKILTLVQIGAIFSEMTDYDQALQFLLEAKEVYDQKPFVKTGQPFEETDAFLFTRLGNVYEKLDRLDSSLWYQHVAARIHIPASDPGLMLMILRRLGVTHFRIGNYDSALYYYHKAIDFYNPEQGADVRMYPYISLAEFYEHLHKPDSVFYYAHLAFLDGGKLSENQVVMEASQLLSNLHRNTGRMDSALYYTEVSMAMKNSLYGPDKLRQVQLLVLSQLQEQQKAEREEQLFRNRTKLHAMLAAVLVFLLIALILFFNNRQKQKSNVVLQKTISDLKTTQAKLIQSEKMASLGELTAGIAHEIQNPLNFVNNFSEVNKELADELEQEIDKGNTADAKALAKDIKENQDKILHHGKRADAIVKGMLQHSRSSSGIKEPTDINALCDEYLRLSYHGYRAKDKSFNAKFETDFDSSLPKINVVPQDIGRVVLNLINNAFYAVNEKAKLQAAGYEPQVVISTKKSEDEIFICVKDNGKGIPDSFKEKIFQPFFTTKPTGHGTGLGLSLSYDIVKAHGGELRVETKEGEGSDFILILPAS